MNVTQKCWECGKIATHQIMYDFDDDNEVIDVLPEHYHFRCYCKECAEKVKAQHEQEMREHIRLKKRMMFYKALSLLERQNAYMYKLKDAIDAVEEHLTENPDKYDSAYEVLASIVLVYNKIYAKRQCKIGKYLVDFVIPEKLVILEIDGAQHKHRKDYDRKRDAYIKKELGAGWEIIRIKTEYLDQNAIKLPDAIDAVVKYREKSV